jgi:hypothetical protein
MSERGKRLAVEYNLPRRSFLQLTASALVTGFSETAFSAPIAGQGELSAATFSDSVGVCLHLGNRQTPYASLFDKVIQLLKDIGIRVLAGAGFRFSIVCHDALNPYLYTPARMLPEIYDWCDQSIEMFEGANEPALTRRPGINPAISADHQRAIYAMVKNTARLKDIIVASPSYIQNNVAIAENLSDAVDWINVHPYPGMEHPETKGPGALDGFIAGSERILGKKPAVVTETGYHTAVQTTNTHLPVSEGIKTRYFPRLLLWNFIAGVKRTYIYEFVDSFNKGVADHTSNFGLADFGGNPKTSFLAVKQLLSLFNQPSSQSAGGPELHFNLVGNSQDLLTAAFKRKDGSRLLFSWLGVSGWDPGTRMARPPVERRSTLAVDPVPRTVVAHRFQDDGSVTKTPLSRTAGGFDLLISDQLTALEIAV